MLQINFFQIYIHIYTLVLKAAPGGWAYYVSGKIGTKGHIVAVDLLPMDSSIIKTIQKQTTFFPVQGDFKSMNTQETIRKQVLLSNYNENNSEDDGSTMIGPIAHCIMSDMAANFTGDSRTDALRTLDLCEHALAFAIGSQCFDPTKKLSKNDNFAWKDIGLLKVGGTFICKFFNNCGREQEKDFRECIQRHFQYNTILKPKASRKESAEQYMIATGYLGNYILQNIHMHQ